MSTNWDNLKPATAWPTGAENQSLGAGGMGAMAQPMAWPQPASPTPAQDQLAAQVPPPASPALADRDALLMRWQDARDALAVAKINETKLRVEVFTSCFPNPTEGTNTLELGNGYELKATHVINYNLDKDAAKVEATLAAIAAVDQEGQFIAERLVKWAAELSIGEYRKLSAQHRALIDTVLTTKPGSPQLEIKAPKK
jgi:hypothetical protein